MKPVGVAVPSAAERTGGSDQGVCSTAEHVYESW